MVLQAKVREGSPGRRGETGRFYARSERQKGVMDEQSGGSKEEEVMGEGKVSRK